MNLYIVEALKTGVCVWLSKNPRNPFTPVFSCQSKEACVLSQSPESNLSLVHDPAGEQLTMSFCKQRPVSQARVTCQPLLVKISRLQEPPAWARTAGRACLGFTHPTLPMAECA